MGEPFSTADRLDIWNRAQKDPTQPWSGGTVIRLMHELTTAEAERDRLRENLHRLGKCDRCGASAECMETYHCGTCYRHAIAERDRLREQRDGLVEALTLVRSGWLDHNVTDEILRQVDAALARAQEPKDV